MARSPVGAARSAVTVERGQSRRGDEGRRRSRPGLRRRIPGGGPPADRLPLRADLLRGQHRGGSRPGRGGTTALRPAHHGVHAVALPTALLLADRVAGQGHRGRPHHHARGLGRGERRRPGALGPHRAARRRQHRRGDRGGGSLRRDLPRQRRVRRHRPRRLPVPRAAPGGGAGGYAGAHLAGRDMAGDGAAPGLFHQAERPARRRADAALAPRSTSQVSVSARPRHSGSGWWRPPWSATC